MEDLIVYLVAYLVGTLPTGPSAGKLLKKSAGKKLGPVTRGKALKFLLDAAKGAVAVAVAHAVSPHDEPDWVLAGFLAMMGDEFPVFSKFKGVRGLGTTIGVFGTLLGFLLAR